MLCAGVRMRYWGFGAVVAGGAGTGVAVGGAAFEGAGLVDVPLEFPGWL